MKKLFFLSGLARSGSTLLGSILNQHRAVHVTPTSPTLDLICSMSNTLEHVDTQYTIDKDTLSYNVISSILESSYKHIQKPIVFDKHRGWPRNLSVAQQFIDHKFIGIVTYRPVPEIITSFIKLFDKDKNNFIDTRLTQDRKPINNRNRADYLWRFFMLDPQQSTMHGLANHRENLLPLSYDEIVNDTQATLDKIEKFFMIEGISSISTRDINNTCKEDKDTAWGVKDLHTIRPVIEKTSNDARITLGAELYDYYSQFNLKI